MNIEVTSISFAGTKDEPKLCVKINFSDGKQRFRQSGWLEVLLDGKDYSISELKTAATDAARELLSNAATAELV